MAEAPWGRSRENSLSLRDHELWFVWLGEGWMATHAGRFELRPGFCAWMRPGGIYDAGLDADHALGFTYIHFTCSLASPPEFFRVRDVGYLDAATRRVAELVQRAPQSRWGRSAGAPPAATALLTGVLLDLLALDEVEATGREDPQRDRIEAIAAEMRDRPERRVEVSALAHEAGVTLPHFSRLFRAVMGVSPQQYHLRARLDRARHLLAESDASVTRIAEALGYRDVFFFSKQFARHVGTPPSAYRRAIR